MRNLTSKISLMGLLFALAMAFSYLESMVTIPGMLPGIRLGLSNLVTMYCLFFLGKGAGYTMAVMKSLFVLLTRGFVAGLAELVRRNSVGDSDSPGRLADQTHPALYHAQRAGGGLSQCRAANLGPIFDKCFPLLLYTRFDSLRLGGGDADGKNLCLDNPLSSGTLPQTIEGAPRKIRIIGRYPGRLF